MAESAAERTEPATPRRLEEARNRGEVAMSRDVNGVLGLATAVALLLGAVGSGIVQALAGLSREAWSGALATSESIGDFHALLLHQLVAAGAPLLPFFAVLLAVAVGAPLVQVGPLLASEAFRLRFERMNPINGVKRLVSVERLFDLAKALFKMAVILVIARWVLAPHADAVLALLHVEPGAGLDTLRSLSRALAAPLVAALAALAALDLAWVRYRHQHRLRMTRQEVREEVLQREGNPHVRARMRQTARELSRLRLQADVARADVVIRNPTHFAVALGYDRARMGAPTVLAKGRDRVARRILEIARAHEVPIVEDPPLARLLHRSVPTGREIPVHLYEAIAEVLAWVYRLDQRRAAGWGTAS